MPTVDALWEFLLPGYLVTIAIETPVLLLCLSKRHSTKEKILAGISLTAFTYPFVVLIFPVLLWEPFGRLTYLIIAEIFAPVAECLLFYWLWIRLNEEKKVSIPFLNRPNMQDFSCIILANLCSFIPFEILQRWGIFLF